MPSMRRRFAAAIILVVALGHPPRSECERPEIFSRNR
jgi:hypothetical protein